MFDLEKWADDVMASGKNPARKRAQFAVLGQNILPGIPQFHGVMMFGLGLINVDVSGEQIDRLVTACGYLMRGELDTLPTDYPDMIRTVWTGKGWGVEPVGPLGQIMVDGVNSVASGLLPRPCEQCGHLFVPLRRDNIHCCATCRVNASSKRRRGTSAEKGK